MGERSLATAREIYDFIKEYHDLHQYAPSLSEIAKGIKMDKSTIHAYTQRMLDDGSLETDVDTYENRAPRTIRVGKRP